MAKNLNPNYKEKYPSIREMLNGNFSTHFLIEKVKYEYSQSLVYKGHYEFYYNAMNFSLSITHLLDWYWHMELKDSESWRGKYLRDFRNWIRTQSAEVICFIDLANTFKHASRKEDNYLVTNLLLLFYPTRELHKVNEELSTNGFYLTLKDKGEIFFLPVLRVKNGDFYYYKTTAEKALNWWKNFENQKNNIT